MLGVVCAALIGAASGFLGSIALYERELHRQAQFLDTCNPESNMLMRVRMPSEGWRDLARAMNHQLQDVRDDRVSDVQHQEGFQRDLSALSHDIRTPLTGAKGYLQLAGRRLWKGESDQAESYLTSASERLDAAGVLLEKLSVYVCSHDPDCTYDLKPVALLPLLVSVLTAHLPEFESKGWEPVISFKDEGIIVVADKAALRRVFENLIANGLKHGTSTISYVQDAISSAP